MKLERWHVAAVGGLVGAGLVLAVLVPRTVRHLEARGAGLERQVAQRRGSIGGQVLAMKGRLSAFAEAETRRVAEEHMRTHYGITEERMRNLDALARRLGAS